MLIKQTISNNKFYSSSEEFSIISVAPVKVNNTYKVIIRISGKYDFNKSKRLVLYRTLDDGGVFEEIFEVLSSYIIKGENVTNVIIKYDNLLNYLLKPSYINDYKVYCFEDDTKIQGSELVFTKTKHICIRDRGNINIKHELSCEETFAELGNDFCGGYVLYDNKVLYSATTNSGVMLNIATHKLIYEGESYDTFIPFSKNGYDNRHFMFILHDDNVKFDVSKRFVIADCRFFEDVGGEWTAHQNTVVRTINNTINLTIPLSNDFSSNLFHDTLLEDYINEIKESYVSKQLDYEKTMFTPVYYNEHGCFELNSIRFNIFLRNRHFFEDTMEWKLASYKEEPGGNGTTVITWSEDDNVYWNSYTYDSSGNFLYNGDTSNTGDLLGDLGFDDNDVFNQNKRLGKTFIRLLFFDSKDRNTQTLLYYSTIFINTVDLYSKYMNNIVLDTILQNGVERYVDNYVDKSELREKTQLSCNFTCFNKHNMSGSSEGYYLYLFPMLVEDGEREIYMRVEFNHAKYGQTIPLVSLDEPKKNYTKKITFGTTNKITTDLSSLYDDMYIPIKIKYCNNKKSYVWYFSDIEENNPSFNLWEPKVR